MLYKNTSSRAQVIETNRGRVLRLASRESADLQPGEERSVQVSSHTKSGKGRLEKPKVKKPVPKKALAPKKVEETPTASIPSLPPPASSNKSRRKGRK